LIKRRVTHLLLMGRRKEVEVKKEKKLVSQRRQSKR